MPNPADSNPDDFADPIAAVGGWTLWDRIAVMTAPKKEAIASRSEAASKADDLFWNTFHNGEYDNTQNTLEVLTAAYRTIISLVMAEIAIIGLCNSQMVQAENISRERTVDRERILSQRDSPLYTYEIARKYPHQTNSFTEGLVMLDGWLYESSGRYGQSRLMKINPETGEVLQERLMDSRYFGEGIAIVGDRIYQLTYRENTGFVYNRDSLTPMSQFQYQSQGWGLTTDGERLIMSNGSSNLLFLDAATLNVEHHISVSDSVGPVGFLNELEYVDGYIYANVWQTDFIAKISTESGKITGWIDLTGLDPGPSLQTHPRELNGIAYNDKTRHLIVTGKYWSGMYEIEMVLVQKR